MQIFDSLKLCPWHVLKDFFVFHLFFFLISKISLNKKGTKSLYTKCVQQICQHYKVKEQVPIKSNKE